MASERCYVYVDGSYVQKALTDAGKSREFDPTKPAQFVRDVHLAQNVSWQLWATRIFYYDAADDTDPAADEKRRYLDRVRRLPDTHVAEGDVRRRLRDGRREQKGVDVQLAVDALSAAFSGQVAAIALVTGDADFVPLVEAIRHAGPHVLVMAFEQSLSEKLRATADRVVLLPYPPEDWELSA